MSMNFRLLRRVFFGQALPTKRMKHQLLPKYLALPVFASDALSSTAYATEEVLLALSLAGAMALPYGVPIAVAVCALIAIVALSYSQTIMAYPTGGGSYIVACENLGLYPGLIAAAAILTDYVLTVAVSIASGVAAITSAVPVLINHKVALCLLFIGFVSLANLRGSKESGKLFACPAYLFILCLLVMIGAGFFQYVVHHGHLQPLTHETLSASQPLTIFLILRAFASGCSAMTGTEAISDGVPAFQEPQSRNARTTLFWMAAILAVLFFGISFLAHAFQAIPKPDETIVSQLARGIFGRGWFYYVIQAATAMILILAANTSYADFPRLSSILARHGYAPRQLANLGDRLVFSNGILLLGVFSAVLVIAFHGNTHSLIPLYAVGVFMAFTLSQAGMVRRWWLHRGSHWKLSATINAIGAITTGVVLVVIAVMKFTHGAWIVCVLIPLIVWHFIAVNRHYRICKEQLYIGTETPRRYLRHHVIVLVPGIHRGVLRALAYARTISEDPEGVYVEIDPAQTSQVVAEWRQFGMDTPLRVLKSPWRSMTEPVLGYVDMLLNEEKVDLVTVVIAEFVTTKLWHRMLHNASGLLLKLVLLFKPNVVVTNIRYVLHN
ncbi:MAG: hypothetical protein AUJ92_19215 [Armatimonadetes bacterium CG2_30_59_28]|nr:MAG: hypothetical protein AUJ92_19215 [Armatimonadetes bacterium CG2_30_59_28]